METFPCSNCAKAHGHCEVLESRRGKHRRRPTRLEHSLDDNQGDEGVGGRSLGVHSPPHDDSNQCERANTKSQETRHDHESDINVTSSTPATRDSAVNEVPHKRDRGEGAELFLGESATLRCVYDDQAASSSQPSPEVNARLRYPLPETPASEATLSEWESQRKQRKMAHLQEDGVFDMPEPAVFEMLLGQYFQWFHPCFPLVDRVQILSAYMSSTLSPLLSLAMLSVAAAFCEDETLAQAGLVSRQWARYSFYSRAKDLYEADHEMEKPAVIQALFLMSFWRSGRLLDKHTRHWLGIAITLAQSSAMHRCFPRRDSARETIRRRIWWSIYIRERQCSAALGLPSRIRDGDCDVETPRPEDMEEAALPDLPLAKQILPPQTPSHVSYFVEMARLAQILGEIIDFEYTPGNITTSDNKTRLQETLSGWEGRLPEHISSRLPLGESMNLHAAMLHLAYNNLLILLFRNSYLRSDNGPPDPAGSVALQAARRSSTVVEDLLSRGLMRHTDIHLINGLFNTLCIHVVHLKSARGTVRSVTEHRARLCLLALQELQKTWQVTVWLLQLRLFFKALDRPTAQCLQIDNGEGFLQDELTDPFTNILPPGTSIQPQLWDEYALNGGDMFMGASSRDVFSAMFEWPTMALEGLEESQRDLVQTNADVAAQNVLM